jgi:hypothetical protein
MIVSYGQRDPLFERYLDRVVNGSDIEANSDGFEHFVADPSDIGMESGVVGMVTTQPDGGIELEVVLGADIPENTRDVLSKICVGSVVATDRYSVARACHEAAPGVNPDDLPDFRHHFGTHLNVTRDNIFAMDRGGRSGEIHPLTRATVQSALGWLHTFRPTDDGGQTAIEQLTDSGLIVPQLNSGERLAGLLRTNEGTQRVGIVSATERGDRHRCPCCSGQILQSTQRITLVLDQQRHGRDHHHYHPTCFAESNLGRLDISSARIEPNPYVSS